LDGGKDAAGQTEAWGEHLRGLWKNKEVPRARSKETFGGVHFYSGKDAAGQTAGMGRGICEGFGKGLHTKEIRMERIRMSEAKIAIKENQLKKVYAQRKRHMLP